jgi:lantibiotic modifying enzyme
MVELQRLLYTTSLQRTHIAWRSFLEGHLRTRAQETACFVAKRMRNPEYVNEVAEIAKKQSTTPFMWSPTNLGSGHVGLALMYSYVDACFPGQGWDTFAQQYLRSAAAETQRMTLVFPGLFAGTAGLAFTLSQANQRGARYQKTLSSVHKGLCAQVLALSWQRPEMEKGVAFGDYDLIAGAAGILAYLVSLEQVDQAIEQAIAHLLTYLMWLGEPGQPCGQERWYIPPELQPNELYRQRFPRGNFNCGLAHGVPGLLATLSLTWLDGYRTPGLRETIAYLANWVVEHRIEQEWGTDWPDGVPLESAAEEQAWQHLSPSKTAWCYGTPGVSRSLWLAGYALEDDELLQMGRAAIEAVLRRTIPQRGIPSPIICHGIAGLLQICLRFAHECESELVKAQIPKLVEQILEAFDPSFPLGFRDTARGDMPRDQPCWLDGAPGIAMVLLAASTNVVPTWDRVLALA